jgi:hypothetical protein
MKQVIALFLALVIATPALADHRNNHHNGYNNHHGYQTPRHRHKNNDKWVVPLIGGIVLGAIISDAKAKERENNRKIVVVKEPQRHCEELTIIVQNRWGDILERRTEYRCTEY